LDPLGVGVCERGASAFTWAPVDGASGYRLRLLDGDDRLLDDPIVHTNRWEPGRLPLQLTAWAVAAHPGGPTSEAAPLWVLPSPVVTLDTPAPGAQIRESEAVVIRWRSSVDEALWTWRAYRDGAEDPDQAGSTDVPEAALALPPGQWRVDVRGTVEACTGEAATVSFEVLADEP